MYTSPQLNYMYIQLPVSLLLQRKDNNMVNYYK